jgi:hypothetical protein
MNEVVGEGEKEKNGRWRGQMREKDEKIKGEREGFV